MNKFEKVSRFNDVEINLPVRKTAFSAGYDFEVAEDTVVPPYNKLGKTITKIFDEELTYNLEEMATITKHCKMKPTLVPTGVKCKLDPNTFLQLSVRSSCPLKYWLVLANGVGIIDSDYYNNPDNEGEIFFQIINLSPVAIQLKKGDVIGQGVILPYLITENDTDSVKADRVGGFGSTN